MKKLTKERKETLLVIEKVHAIDPEAGEYLMYLYEQEKEGTRDSCREGGISFCDNLNGMLMWGMHPNFLRSWNDLYRKVGTVRL